MNDDPNTRLAVYGTLRPGESNHHLLANVPGAWLEGTVRGVRFMAKGYPAFKPDTSAGEVPVSVLTSSSLPEHWPRLDDFEGADYRRVLVPVRLPSGVTLIANLYEYVGGSARIARPLGYMIRDQLATLEEPAPFGTLLRELRISLGLTQADLAGRAGLSVRGTSDLERGRSAHVAAFPRANRAGQAKLLASQTVDSIEFYPGYFGNEEKWTGWTNPRECAPGDLANCIANTKAMRQAALTILGTGSPPSGTPLTTIETLAGNGGTDYSGDNGPASSAQIYGPTAVAIDRYSGNLYVVDAGNYVVRRVDSNGVIHAFAGSKTADNTCVGGRPTNVGLDNPQGVAVDKSGNVYIADAACAMVFKVDAAGKALTIVAGTFSPTSTGTGDGGPATNTQLSWPVGAAVDAAGTIYIADASANTIRTVDKGGIIHTLAGNGAADYMGDGGAATKAALSSPSGVAVDRAGNVYIADTGNSVVRQVDKSGIIHTVAGSAAAGYAGDEGPATAAQLQSPSGVAVDGLDGVYIADSGNNVIRYVEPSAHTIHTVAGNGTGDFAGDGGLPTGAELALPAGVAEEDRLAVGDQFDTVTVYIADTINNRVRQISTTPIRVGPGR